MPKKVSEVSAGTQFSRSNENEAVADQQNRVFRVILNSPSEVVNPTVACGVNIGDAHPVNLGIFCTSFDVRFEGDSRVLLVCTFNYSTRASSSGNDQSGSEPGTREANWSTSTSLIEVPIYSLARRHNGGAIGPGAAGFGPILGFEQPGWEDFAPAVNPAGDMYDAATHLTGMVNINITQEAVNFDPLQHNQYCGYVNEEEMKLGSLTMAPHTVMFRGVQTQPFVTAWGGRLYRGWKATYEFAYKRNRTKIMLAQKGPQGRPAAETLVDLGWDVAIPQTGFNVKAFDPKNPAADDDIFGQPLRHGKEDSEYAGRIIPAAGGGYFLPEGTAVGERVPAMVKIFSYQGGGESQARAASPVALNDNGHPRKEAANPKVLVYGYQVQPSINLTQTLNLRLF
jgi:hypothetical protein